MHFREPVRAVEVAATPFDRHRGSGCPLTLPRHCANGSVHGGSRSYAITPWPRLVVLMILMGVVIFESPRAVVAPPGGYEMMERIAEASPRPKAKITGVVYLLYFLTAVFSRQAGTDANERLQPGFAESHAAAVKHAVITIEKTIGKIKRYLQLTTVMTAKQRAKAHTVTRMTAKVSAGRLPSCHANTAANK
jgi:hypothetical protein